MGRAERHTQGCVRPATEDKAQQGSDDPAQPPGRPPGPALRPLLCKESWQAGGQSGVHLLGCLQCPQEARPPQRPGSAQAPHPFPWLPNALHSRLRGGARSCWLHFRGETAPGQEAAGLAVGVWVPAGSARQRGQTQNVPSLACRSHLVLPGCVWDNQLNCHESGQCMLASNSGGGQRQLSGKDLEPERELGVSTWKAISPSLLHPITAACVL